MSYQIYDANGFVADLATNQGTWDLLKFFKSQDDADLKEFGGDCSIELSEDNIKKLKGLHSDDKTIEATLIGLKSVLDKCDEILIIGDGSENEDEPKSYIKSLEKGQTLIDISAFKKRYTELMTPVLRAALSEAIQRGQELITPTNPHRSSYQKADVFTQAALTWLKSRIGWAAAEIGDETANLLANQLAIGFEAGESIPQIATRVEQVFGFSNEVRANRIARTETIMASSQGSIEGYRSSGVVDEVKFYAALDERTCEDCMFLHNEVMSLADSEGVITVHPNCRCVWIPIVK